MTKEAFAEGLRRIRESAAGQEGKIRVAQILAAFPDAELTREQIAAVYSFLEREGIALAAYELHDTADMSLSEGVESGLLGDGAGTLSESEQKILEAFERDLIRIRPVGARESEELAKTLLEGSDEEKQAAKTRLAEGNLHWMARLAKKRAGRGVPVMDLIQEGSLALLLALEEYTDGGDLEDMLELAVTARMEALILEQKGYDRAAQDFADDANRILDLARELEADTDQAVSPEELSRRLNLPIRRIEEILRESANAVKNMER